MVYNKSQLKFLRDIVDIRRWKPASDVIVSMVFDTCNKHDPLISISLSHHSADPI